MWWRGGGGRPEGVKGERRQCLKRDWGGRRGRERGREGDRRRERKKTTQRAEKNQWLTEVSLPT